MSNSMVSATTNMFRLLLSGLTWGRGCFGRVTGVDRDGLQEAHAVLQTRSDRAEGCRCSGRRPRTIAPRHVGGFPYRTGIRGE